ncbi:MAG TPA: cytochrome c [Gemmatimonadales bacterium]|nr:cytochrome c [Gemmatimonadales bacterium]
MRSKRLFCAVLGLLAVLWQTASGQDREKAPKVTRVEYDGWRQYSVHCARCHGQDVLPNPVAANLLVSVAPGGRVNTLERFNAVVTAGLAERGMPSFKGVLTPEQIKAIHGYVAGRAAKRIPPGRPAPES